MSLKVVEEKKVEDHFDSLAASYDQIKKEKNGYYYQCLIQTVAEIVPPGKKVLDIGTGTGEILHALKPSLGTGVDLSSGMIQIARRKFPYLSFFSGSYEGLDLGNSFDFILLVDVIEHLESPETLFGGLKKFCNPSTQVVLTMANPGWEPFLHVLEKLKLKMEEGPHHRISQKELLGHASREGFKLVSSDTRVLLPVFIPLVTPFFNDFLGKLPLLKKLTLIERYIFQLS